MIITENIMEMGAVFHACPTPHCIKMFNILFKNLQIGMKIHIWIAKWFLTIQIRKIPYHWKSWLQYLLCPRVFRTTHVYKRKLHTCDNFVISCALTLHRPAIVNPVTRDPVKLSAHVASTAPPLPQLIRAGWMVKVVHAIGNHRPRPTLPTMGYT